MGDPRKIPLTRLDEIETILPNQGEPVYDLVRHIRKWFTPGVERTTNLALGIIVSWYLQQVRDWDATLPSSCQAGEPSDRVLLAQVLGTTMAKVIAAL